MIVNDVLNEWVAVLLGEVENHEVNGEQYLIDHLLIILVIVQKENHVKPFYVFLVESVIREEIIFFKEDQLLEVKSYEEISLLEG